MISDQEFNSIFKSPRAKAIGVKLKAIIEEQLEGIEGNMVGGAKVKLVLYSRNGNNNVLCGIKEGIKDSCLLYVHHVNQEDSPVIKFSGKGKHARTIRYNNLEEIDQNALKVLLNKVDTNAPL